MKPFKSVLFITLLALVASCSEEVEPVEDLDETKQVTFNVYRPDNSFLQGVTIEWGENEIEHKDYVGNNPIYASVFYLAEGEFAVIKIAASTDGQYTLELFMDKKSVKKIQLSPNIEYRIDYNLDLI